MVRFLNSMGKDWPAAPEAVLLDCATAISAPLSAPSSTVWIGKSVSQLDAPSPAELAALRASMGVSTDEDADLAAELAVADLVTSYGSPQQHPRPLSIADTAHALWTRTQHHPAPLSKHHKSHTLTPSDEPPPSSSPASHSSSSSSSATTSVSPRTLLRRLNRSSTEGCLIVTLVPQDANLAAFARSTARPHAPRTPLPSSRRQHSRRLRSSSQASMLETMVEAAEEGPDGEEGQCTPLTMCDPHLAGLLHVEAVPRGISASGVCDDACSNDTLVEDAAVSMGVRTPGIQAARRSAPACVGVLEGEDVRQLTSHASPLSFGSVGGSRSISGPARRTLANVLYGKPLGKLMALMKGSKA